MGNASGWHKVETKEGKQSIWFTPYWLVFFANFALLYNKQTPIKHTIKRNLESVSAFYQANGLLVCPSTTIKSNLIVGLAWIQWIIKKRDSSSSLINIHNGLLVLRDLQEITKRQFMVIRRSKLDLLLKIWNLLWVNYCLYICPSRKGWWWLEQGFYNDKFAIYYWQELFCHVFQQEKIALYLYRFVMQTTEKGNCGTLLTLNRSFYAGKRPCLAEYMKYVWTTG